jgi:chromate transporter
MKTMPPTPLQIFLSFLKLGCMAFGGPIAHLGYFEEEFVRRRKWLTAVAYADMVALCQFLPGPASSQVGFAIGHLKGGVIGAFAAWLGFTLPSALLMIGFALGLSSAGELAGAGWVTGLKLAAVAVVAQAVLGMAVKLCPDRLRAIIGLGAAALLLVVEEAFFQVLVIVIGGLLGWVFFREKPAPEALNIADKKAKKGAWVWLLLFFIGLLGLPLARHFSDSENLAVLEGFYRAGALVFGGGHVVLPLLDSFTVGQGWIEQDVFIAGYGAAQALPGPLFSFAGFLGAALQEGPGGMAGGLLALVAIYLPSWFLVLGVLPYWNRLRTQEAVRAALQGTNAAVVGLLGAAFLGPIWSVAATDSSRIAFALGVFALLHYTRTPVWILVAGCAGLGSLVF